ncbi:LacI family DNA-binding transcriptional regulator [Acidipropionibacterium virtanenii]|uniref:HTH-type transcriptional regulator GalS n=1 Tax=Acidipropionibacterium virtanenii TaxID=2057246 RepID=A0A344UXX7_9ACTN|nr:LacI family DNA-binding transcriptional regulator [Acidipropionibacterium virtanenii]AXE40125.1 HTH-type transcriptional regulator GalS [Acidipropionibacterium virtanenii]
MSVKPARPATRTDVARLAGVSTTVVSYVINDGPRRVTSRTRQRVLDAIERLGYRPNANARALKTGETGLIGMVVPEVVNAYFAEFIQALDRAAQTMGSSILLGITYEEAGREERAVRSLVDRGVDSLIYQVDLADQRLYQLGGGDLPRVLLDRSDVVPGMATVGADTEAGARAAVEHLVSHGHERIGYVGSPMAGRKVDLRRVVWDEVLREHGLPGVPPALTSWNREGGYRGARELMASDEPPTAIFAGSDLIGVGVLRALHELGMDVPGDVAVVSFDGTAESAYSWPPLTAVRQPFEEMARRALEVLSERGEAPGSSVFPMQLIVRGSCGCQG